MVDIKVDNDKCDGCGECEDICPQGVYEMKDNKAVPVNIEDCEECCSCVEVCPNDAITHGSC